MVQVICSTCNKEISKENLLKYTGATAYRKICKPCLNKKSK